MSAGPASSAGPLSPRSGFTAGNIVVCRIGDGSKTLSGNAFPVFLDEYTSSGTLVQSVALPTGISGSNLPLTLSGNAPTECQISRSPDGKFIVVPGYAALVNAGSVASSNAPRVIARIDAAGAIDTTSSTTSFSTNTIRGATTLDGTGFWMVGSAGGVVYIGLGGDDGGTLGKQYNYQQPCHSYF